MTQSDTYQTVRLLTSTFLSHFNAQNFHDLGWRYTTDAVLEFQSIRTTIQGRENIEVFWRNFFATHGTCNLTLTVTSAIQYDEALIVTGTFELHFGANVLRGEYTKSIITRGRRRFIKTMRLLS